jgi:hypothetical protein
MPGAGPVPDRSAGRRLRLVPAPVPGADGEEAERLGRPLPDERS